MAYALPVFQIIFWLSTPALLILIAYFAFKEFKLWKISMALSAFTFLNAVAIIIEMFSNNQLAIVAILFISGLIMLVVGQKLRKAS